jgi:ABC-2 type transport system ATP-binding protein
MPEEFAIQTKGLIKNYGNVKALLGVDLEVKKGEIFGFLGPNGAGKTTTIRCMLDLIRPQGGSIRIFGIDPQADSVSVRERVGYLPGELSMESNLKVENQLQYYADLRSNSLKWGYVEELARRLELDLKLSIKNLSKGNKQKVGVVQSLMSRPELLLMDEPTSGLDPLMQQEVYTILREAKEDGATVFFSSHIINEVEALADRVAIISKGVIIEEAEPSKLGTMEMRSVRVRFKESMDVSALSQIEGVTLITQADGLATFRVEGEMDGLIKGLANFPVSDLAVERTSLEEVFLRYYRAGDKEKS